VFDAGSLLKGPRGRRLCWCLLADVISVRLRNAAVFEGDVTGLIDDLAACAGRVAVGDSLMSAFGDVVASAAYWQEPDNEDRALASDAVREALAPVAEAVSAAPAARWWSTPIALERQMYVEWASAPETSPVSLSGSAAKLVQWRVQTLDDEERAGRERPSDPSAPYSGYWWSTPELSELNASTRTLPSGAAVGLSLVEDSLGWTEARCWPVLPRPDARVYEVRGPSSWVALVEHYPLDVSKARRHDWWRATGMHGRWLIPDFAAVAADYDAVHLTAAAYLTTAGRALPVGDAQTVLAGWDPDKTYWLADVLSLDGDPQRWVQDDEHDACAWQVARA
jgi:hypothetical protein